MKLIIVNFLIIIALISCKENEKENSTIAKEIFNSEKIVAKNLNSYFFYKLDDKYSTEKDSLIITNWLKEKSQTILKNDSIYNIFQQNGGGPNGAEWNPGTDLFIAVLTSNNVPSETPKIYLNGKLYKNQIYKYNPNLIWYKVKYDVWEQEVRGIDSDDIQKMFSAEFLNGVKKGKLDTVAPLEYGEVLRFDISYKENRITKFFHATYGE